MPVRMLRFVQCLLWLGAAAPVASAGVVTLRFDELESYADSLSLQAQWIDREYDLTASERDADLAWSNPEVSFDREVVNRLAENEVTISKQIEAPWAYSKKRSAWDKRIQSAELWRRRSTSLLLAELKSGYTGLWLQDEYLKRLGQLRSILTDASQIADSRHSEGHLSGVEEHLVQMSVISLHASFQAVRQERREAAAAWMARLGLPPGDTVSLVTPIRFKLIPLEESGRYVAQLDSQPEARSRALLEQFHLEYASAERGRIIPGISLYGGYKSVEPSLDGYVAGFSLSIPLFNTNRAAARRFELEGERLAAENRMQQSERAAQVLALVESIEEAHLPLSAVTEHFSEDLEALDGLLLAYDEGMLSLSDLLNGLQIELAGLRDYFEQWMRYYDNVFMLEALTGARLLTFP